MLVSIESDSSGGALARSAVRALERARPVAAVGVIGSMARGDWTDSSDIDLVILSDTHHRRSAIEELLPAPLRSDRLSFLVFTPHRWLTEAREGSLFIQHVREEGIVAFDKRGDLRTGLALAREVDPDIDGEIRRQLHRVRLYREPERLNGQHLFALSHLYAIGKAIAIARSFEHGTPTFVKDIALQRLAVRQPSIAAEVETVRRLRPFYDLTRSRPAELPFPHTDAEGELRAAVRAVECLARPG